MSIIGSNILAGASGQAGYNLNNSLRYRGSNSANLQRTPASATNRTTWTWSAWIKRGTIGTQQGLFIGNYDGNDNSTCLLFDGGDNLIFFNRLLTVSNGNIYTTQVFRDTSAWYHIVVAMDTTQATAANRYKLYINGTQVTSFQIATYPTQNTTMYINSNVQHNIGFRRDGATNYYFDGYMAEVNFVDGSQLTPSSFGETSLTTGSWIPKKYTSTYGTNGFYLKFADTSAATAAAIGKDSSGNGNNWTPSGISVTAGTTYDAMLDVPTNTSATVANYCTWNPILPPSSSSEATNVLNGNLQLKGYNTSYNTWAVGSIEVSSGKWYYEFTNTNAADWQRIGIISTSGKLNPTDATAYYMYYSTNGNKISTGGIDVAYGNSWTTNDIIGVALDLDNGKIFFSKNGTWQASGDPAAGTNAAYTGLTGAFAPTSLIGSAVANSVFANFGQRPFTYTPPTGYVRLNTYNLPTPTILQGNKYMDATLYTGTGASLAITNAGAFKPDMVWIGPRSTGNDKGITDSVRGVTKQIYTNLTNTEYTDATFITSLNSNGFTAGTSGGLNASAVTYVGWQWQAGQGTTSSNTSGTITSTVSVNTTAGFSVATGTTLASGTLSIGHGLGVSPAMVIYRSRNSAAQNWWVWHKSLPNAATGRALLLNSTGAEQAGAYFGTPSVSSTVVTIAGAALNSDAFVLYSWAEIAGFSKFGSYTGNGSADGPMIFTGFTPKFLMFKRTDTTSGWYIHDSSRNTSNVVNLRLLPNTSDAEATVTTLDFLSNGFKLRTSDVDRNASGGTYIYACFASNPFRNSNAF